MIIFRYLAKEVLGNMFAVSIVLLLIFLSGRFVSYLADAAAGKLDAGVLLTLIVYSLPAYLELILPLGLFVGILLAYGRLYVDSEMAVMSACGISEARLVVYTLLSASFVALVVAFFSLYLGPKGIQATATLMAEQRSRTDFETLTPARFHDLNDGQGVTYAEEMSRNNKRLNKVFIAELPPTDSGLSPTILVAETGETVVDERLGKKYLLLKNGRRYLGKPGEADYEVVQFKEYSQVLPQADYAIGARKASDGTSTLDLLKQDTIQASAALQWRLSLPLLVMIVSLLAVPLSRTQPRKGRYGKLLPAILLYIIYLVVINGVRGIVEENKAPVPGLLWLVHAAFFTLAMALFAGEKLFAWLPFKK